MRRLFNCCFSGLVNCEQADVNQGKTAGFRRCIWVAFVPMKIDRVVNIDSVHSEYMK